MKWNSKKMKLILSILPKISLIRTLYYRFRYKCNIIVGKGAELILDKNSEIIINGSLFIGVDYNWHQKTILEIDKNGILIVNGSASFMKGSKTVISKEARLELGNNSSIGEGSFIKCKKNILIGDNCAISWNATIIDSDLHEIIVDNHIQKNTEEIVIGNNVLIGCNSILLKGVKIGDGAIIGAGSVVSKNIQKNSISVGNPNKIIKNNAKWNP